MMVNIYMFIRMGKAATGWCPGQQRHTKPVAGDSDHHRLLTPAINLTVTPHCSITWTTSSYALKFTTKLKKKKDSSPAIHDQVLSSPAVSVQRFLSRINPHEAARPYKMPGHVLKKCAEELTDDLTDIFNTSLSQPALPICVKCTTIIQIPKYRSRACFSNDRHVVPDHHHKVLRMGNHAANFQSNLPSSLVPILFSYWANPSISDAWGQILLSPARVYWHKDSWAMTVAWLLCACKHTDCQYALHCHPTIRTPSPPICQSPLHNVHTCHI